MSELGSARDEVHRIETHGLRAERDEALDRAKAAEAQVESIEAEIREWPVATDRIAAYYAERIEIVLADAPAADGRTATGQPVSVNADKMMAQMVTEYRRKVGRGAAWHLSAVGPFTAPSSNFPVVIDEQRTVGPWQPLCPACRQPALTREAHYVSSVGHMTDPADSIEPHYSCTGQNA